MKRLVMFLGVLWCMLLTGCMETTQLNQRLLVQAVGVDYDAQESLYHVTAQVFSAEDSSPGEAFDPHGKNNRIYTGSGESIGDALRSIGESAGKKVFLGSNRVIVVSEASADRLMQVLNYFNSSHEISPQADLLLSRESASEVVSAQLPQGIVPAASLQRMVEFYSRSGLCADSTLLSVTRSLSTPNEGALVTHVDVTGAQEEPEVKILGAVTVGSSGVVARLDQTACRGLGWIRGSIGDTSMVLKDPYGNRYTVQLRPVGHLLTAEMAAGAPRLKLRLQLDCVVTEVLRQDGRGITAADAPALAALVEEQVHGEVALAADQILVDHGLDVFHAASYLEKYCPQYYQAHEREFSAKLGALSVDAQVQVDISALGLGAGAAET